MVEALKACGGNVKFTVYPEADHDSWTQTYNNPALFDWFLQHRRERVAR
jgi:predicted peptidase